MNLDELRAKLAGRNFLGPRETGEIFFDGLDERTVRRAAESGQIPSVKVGTRTLIPVPPLLAMLDAHAHAPAAETTTTQAVSPEALRVAVRTIRASLDAIEALLAASEETGSREPSGEDLVHAAPGQPR